MRREPKERIAAAIEEFLEGCAELFVQNLLGALPPAPGARHGAARINGVHRHLDMTCRVPGCVHRSRGPRFRFMCAEHSGLPKAEQVRHCAEYRNTTGGVR